MEELQYVHMNEFVGIVLSIWVKVSRINATYAHDFSRLFEMVITSVGIEWPLQEICDLFSPPQSAGKHRRIRHSLPQAEGRGGGFEGPEEEPSKAGVR